jgi:hypothetical protein
MTTEGNPVSDSITCPVCGMTSHHPEDIKQGYCGNCHAFTSGPNVDAEVEPCPCCNRPPRHAISAEARREWAR